MMRLLSAERKRTPHCRSRFSAVADGLVPKEVNPMGRICDGPRKGRQTLRYRLHAQYGGQNVAEFRPGRQGQCDTPAQENKHRHDMRRPVECEMRHSNPQLTVESTILSAKPFFFFFFFSFQSPFPIDHPMVLV